MIESRGQSFCCRGCETVHGFLNNHGLTDYYDLADGEKGLRVLSERSEDQLQILKSTGFEEGFVRYRDSVRVHYVFRVPTIHCRACVWLLEKIPAWVDGVSKARVNLDQGLLEIEASPSEDRFLEIVLQLDKLGYSPDLQPSKDKKSDSLEMRRNWMETGVAGFCFGNVMLFSFPEYLGGEALGKSYEMIFRWLSLIFSIPAFFYSSSSIFRSAFNSFRERKPSVDIPIALGISVLFVWSCSVVILGSGIPYFDSLCGLIFFLLIGRSYQRKSFTHLVFERDDHRFFPISLSVTREGQWKAIPLSELRNGDEYRLRSGGLVPVRSQLMTGEGVLDFRMVTGETDPQIKECGDLVHAGGIQRGGEIVLKAMEDLSESELVRMWGGGEERPSRREALLDRISGVFTIVILGLSLFTFFWHGMNGEALHRACAILIVACPCALALSAPLTLGQIIRDLANRGCFLRHSAMVEDLAEINHMVFDKTGTLTYIDRMSGEWKVKPPTHQIDYFFALTKQSGHPVSRALAIALSQLCEKNGPANREVSEFQELPGKGMKASVAGEVTRIGSPSWLGYEKEGGVILEFNGEFVAHFLPASLVREGMFGALEEMRDEGIEISLMSGDQSTDRSMFSDHFERKAMSFNCSPQDKANKVKGHVDHGYQVAMVGDGLNDGLAMKSAHLGISVPLEDGSFSPNSDVIVRENKLFLINSFRKFCKKGVRNIWVCVSISLGYNILGIYLAFTGLISPMVCAILMPISALSVLFYSVGFTSVMAKRFFKPF